MLILFVPLLQAGNDQQNLEYKVKAAYLYNFTKFVTWPEQAFDASPDAPLSICILGEDPFGHSLDLLANKTARGRTVALNYLQDIRQAGRCHVLYISRSEKNSLGGILQYLGDRPVLTVSDIDGFAVKGGCIRLDIIDGKVRFNINVQAARRAQLKMSAKLLELARVVIE